MHLLYLDESGAVADASQRYFVLAGVAVFERRTHWVERKLDEVAGRFNPSQPSEIELHGSPMRGGRDEWRSHPLEMRIAAIKDALKFGVADFFPRGVRLFGAVVKKASLGGKDPVVEAFEQLSSRFDRFLKRQYLKHSQPERGLIIFDKSSTERRIQTLARDFKHSGHSWGRSQNYAEVPVFLDSRASRLIQLADLVAFALYRFHEHNDNAFYDVIKHCFDSEGGVEHGLYVYV